MKATPVGVAEMLSEPLDLIVEEWAAMKATPVGVAERCASLADRRLPDQPQ